MELKDHLKTPLNPVEQESPVPRMLQPWIYCSNSSSWVPHKENNQGQFMRGSILKVISWDISFSPIHLEDRVSAAATHLQELFGEAPGPLVIMLHEVRQESLQKTLENPWIQRNFVISNIDPPESLDFEVPSDSFVLRRVEWQAAHRFTVMLVSKCLPIKRCFRVHLKSVMGRDALLLDISVSSADERTETDDCLRLCTMHLESPLESRAYRLGQLALVSALLKGTLNMGSRLVGGLVGDDMNEIKPWEHEWHKFAEIDLKDVSEDVPAGPIAMHKPFQKDPSPGNARGNTAGYQSSNSKTCKGLGKFFYTGPIESIAIEDVQDSTGRMGRFGIPDRGRLFVESDIQHLPITPTGHAAPHHKKVDIFFSNHFGSAIGIKLQ